MTNSRKSLAIVLMLVVVQLACAAEFEQNWVYLSCNLRTPEGVDAAIVLLDKAASAGCSYALLTDSSHLNASELPESYFAGIKKVKDKAASLKITLIPFIFPTGYGGRYLNFDKNLAAGLPVKNAPFIVIGKTAFPDPSAAPSVANAGFDQAERNVLAGWSGQDAPGATSFADRETRYGGQSSLKIMSTDSALAEAPPAPGEMRGRRRGRGVTLSQTLSVEPFREYRLSFWIKAEPAGTYRPSLGVTSSNDRRLAFPDLQVEPGQDWKEYSVFFNTLDAKEVTLTLGMNATGGAAWIDDVAIASVGLLNVLRRVNTPVKVTSADGKIIYEEGKDFERIVDPLLDPEDSTHAAPPLKLTAASRIPDGATVLVSWYHPLLLNIDQVNLSISDPAVFQMMDRDMKAASEVWGAPGYFMNVDEIRIAGWEEGPDGPDKAPAQLLADYTSKAVAIIRKYAPTATIYVWSDMYTPFHNARRMDEGAYYYLVNGTWYGSWETLPPDAVIMMWAARDQEAMRWFSGRGNKQVICGYYDGDMKRNIARWMTTSEGVPNVVGMMYTTWKDNYDDLPEFFRLVKTYPEWVTSADREPPRQR